MRVVVISKALVVGAYHTKMDELAHLGVELSLIVPPAWGNIPLEKREGNGYRIFPTKILFSGHNHFHVYRGLQKILQHLKPDIVHIDEEHYSCVTYQAMRAASEVGAKTVFFTWQNIYKRYLFPFSSMEQYVFRKSNAAIVGNSEAGEVLRAKGYTRRIYLIPQFGIDPGMFQKREIPGFREQLGLNSYEFVIGYIGRLVEEKGLRTLLDALSLLPDHSKLILIGSGPFKAEFIKRAIHLGVERRITMVNQVSSFEVHRYMNCMDCLVLPSLTKGNWKEQFGRVLIEAMACEVPVVGSNSGEIPIVINDAGLVFQEGHVDDLFRKISSLMTNSNKRKELSKKGRQRVLENYTQNIIAEKTYQVYTDLLKQPDDD